MKAFERHHGLSREYGIVDEVTEAEPVPRAKEIVTQWIDTVNRPFISMKRLMKGAAAEAIRADLARLDWKESLHAFFQKEVRDTLAFVQAAMDAKA